MENIDVGGPALLRAASKNHRDVLPVVDPADYPDVVRRLEEGGTALDYRLRMAVKAFRHTAAYDAAIVVYLENDPMKVLVVGSGGREHALAWMLARSPSVEAVFAAPGNPGTAAEDNVTNVDVDGADFAGLTGLVRSRGIDLTVVGPEVPLVDGDSRPLRRLRSEVLRTVEGRCPPGGFEGVRQGVHGPPRHTDRGERDVH